MENKVTIKSLRKNLKELRQKHKTEIRSWVQVILFFVAYFFVIKFFNL